MAAAVSRPFPVPFAARPESIRQVWKEFSFDEIR